MNKKLYTTKSTSATSCRAQLKVDPMVADEGEEKCCSLDIQISEEDHDHLQSLGGVLGHSVNDYIRLILHRAACRSPYHLNTTKDCRRSNLVGDTV